MNEKMNKKEKNKLAKTIAEKMTKYLFRDGESPGNKTMYKGRKMIEIKAKDIAKFIKSKIIEQI